MSQFNAAALSLCLSVHLSASAQTATGKVIPAKSESACVQSGGRFLTWYAMPEKQHRSEISKVEAYIWSHWRSRQAGCLTVRFVTLEGETVDTSIFVEKESQANWRVRLERKSILTYRGQPKKRYIERHTYLAYNITKVDEKEYSKGRVSEIADSESYPPGSYSLVFKDKEGQIIFSLEPGNVFN